MTGHIGVDEIPIGEARTVVVDGEQVAVFRLRDGSIRALSAVCPHLGGPLADGISDNRVVICPLHGRTFDLVTGAEVGGGSPIRTWSTSVDDDGAVTIGGATCPSSRADILSEL